MCARKRAVLNGVDVLMTARTCVDEIAVAFAPQVAVGLVVDDEIVAAATAATPVLVRVVVVVFAGLPRRVRDAARVFFCPSDGESACVARTG